MDPPLHSSFLNGHDPHPAPQVTFDLGKMLLAVGLSTLAVASAVVNVLVIASILATRKLRSPANLLICSLALTDLLVSVLVMPVSIVYLSAGRWRLGSLLCHLWLGLDVTCCTCSILHLAAIALDRYRAVTDPIAYAQKRTPRRALITVAAVWLLSVLVSLPPLVWRRQDGAGPGPSQCLIEHDHVAFTVYSTLGAFYVPLLLLLVLYYRIYQAAQTLQNRRRCGAGRQQRHTVSSVVLPTEASGSVDGSGSGLLSPVTLSPTECAFSEPSNEGKILHGPPLRPKPPRRPPGVARERRAALTLGLILGAFVACWLPFFLKEVIANSCPSCHVPASLADGLTWLGYLNSLINPLIYTIFNQDFKKAFKRLLAFHCTHHS